MPTFNPLTIDNNASWLSLMHPMFPALWNIVTKHSGVPDTPAKGWDQNDTIEFLNWAVNEIGVFNLGWRGVGGHRVVFLILFLSWENAEAKQVIFYPLLHLFYNDCCDTYPRIVGFQIDAAYCYQWKSHNARLQKLVYCHWSV